MGVGRKMLLKKFGERFITKEVNFADKAEENDSIVWEPLKLSSPHLLWG